MLNFAVLEGESRHESSAKQQQAAMFVSKDILEKLALSPRSEHPSPLHFSLLEMSIIIQKLLLQVTFVLLLVFYLIGQIIGLPSPSELTGGAPKILR